MIESMWEGSTPLKQSTCCGRPFRLPEYAWTSLASVLPVSEIWDPDSENMPSMFMPVFHGRKLACQTRRTYDVRIWAKSYARSRGEVSERVP